MHEKDLPASSADDALIRFPASESLYDRGVFLCDLHIFLDHLFFRPSFVGGQYTSRLFGKALVLTKKTCRSLPERTKTLEVGR